MSNSQDVNSDAVYQSRELVDLATGGHYVINDTIDAEVRRIAGRFGLRGRTAMCSLPALRQYATKDEFAAWEEQLHATAQDLIASTPARPPDTTSSQPELPFP